MVAKKKKVGNARKVAEYAALGLSEDDGIMASDGVKALSRARAVEMLKKKFDDRDRLKAKIIESQENARLRTVTARAEKRRKWKQKHQHSPFLVDLVAENERLDEENRVRLEAEIRRNKETEKRKFDLQQQVIVRALRDDSEDLEALRREKRAIIEEERRLKALIDLDKVKTRAKLDLQAAERADRQRRAAKGIIRRQVNRENLSKSRQQLRDLLRIATDAPEAPDNTFSSTFTPHLNKVTPTQHTGPSTSYADNFSLARPSSFAASSSSSS